MITLENLSFRYGRAPRPALENLNGSFGPGIRLLVGENGAGKTTLLKILTGVLAPTQGECLLDGTDASTSTPAGMGRTFLLEENMYFPGKTIREFATAHSPFYPGFSHETFCRNLQAFGLTGDEPLKNASPGNRKKAQLAYVLALGVEYLFLDEPTNALDLQAKASLQQLLAAETNENQTVVISTHTISELENLYDGIIVLSHGHIIFSATDEEISERLAFISSPEPPEEALYSELNFGHYLSVVPSDDFCGDTRTDWRRLYFALMSPARETIIGMFSDKEENADMAAQENTVRESAGCAADNGFSWKRVREFAGWNMLKFKKQIIWYPLISLLSAILLLLPVGESAQMGLTTLVWGILPFLAYLAPLVFAMGGDGRIIMRMIPARPAEKLTFYLGYLLIIVPAVLYILPLLASFLYMHLPSIQTEDVMSMLKMRMGINMPWITVTNIVGMLAVIVTCFYFVLRSRNNRIINGIIATVIFLFLQGLAGAIYGMTAAFRMGIADGMAGADPKDEEEIVRRLMEEMTSMGSWMTVITAITALYFAFAIWQTWRLFSHKSNRF